MDIDPEFGEQLAIPVADNRPPAYWEEDQLVIRCSALGGCLWELIASAQGYEPHAFPAFMLKAFKEGQEAEPKIIQHLLEQGWMLEDMQKEGHLRCAPSAIIRYHPDGIGKPPFTLKADGLKRVVEIKALGPDLFKQAQRHGVASTIKEYPWQLSIMMHAEDLPGVWVIYSKETGEVIYEWVDVPIVPLVLIVNKVANLLEALDEDLMDRPCDDPKHFPCRYLSLRPEPDNSADTLSVADVGLEDEFDQLARQYLMVKGQIDELEKKKKEYRDKLLAMSGTFKTVKSNRFQVKIGKGGKGYPMLDKMRKDGVEDKYMEKKEWPTVTVKGLG